MIITNEQLRLVADPTSKLIISRELLMAMATELLARRERDAENKSCTSCVWGVLDCEDEPCHSCDCVKRNHWQDALLVEKGEAMRKECGG